MQKRFTRRIEFKQDVEITRKRVFMMEDFVGKKIERTML